MTGDLLAVLAHDATHRPGSIMLIFINIATGAPRAWFPFPRTAFKRLAVSNRLTQLVSAPHFQRSTSQVITHVAFRKLVVY